MKLQMIFNWSYGNIKNKLNERTFVHCDVWFWGWYFICLLWFGYDYAII